VNRGKPVDQRPSGKDENYQPIPESEQDRKTTASPPKDKYEAGERIDEMLAFLYGDIIKEEARKLTLKGQLADCRHLIEMEMFGDAQDAYHAAIVQYLDPRWTSQLLEDINAVLKDVPPTKTNSELNPNLSLTPEQTVAEVKVLLEPLQRHFGINQIYRQGVDSLYKHLIAGERDAAMDQFRATTKRFAKPVWVDHNSMRLVQIMDHTPALSPKPAPQVQEEAKIALPDDLPPILYFTDKMEGRVVERLRILEAGELMTYKKVTHDWGGKFYFLNDEPTKDTEWLRVWSLYQAQQEQN